MPVILHVRRSVDLISKYLRRHPQLRGIAHAFNGSQQQAEILIEMGFKLGFGGAMTFSRAKQIRRLAAGLPLESIVLETDAPDIPPAWLGQGTTSLETPRNEPAELSGIAQCLAELRGETLQQIATQTSANVRHTFKRLPQFTFSD
nr:TatD family hydrolase [Paenalcaligenes niemegkensis]